MGENGRKRVRPTTLVVDLKALKDPWAEWCAQRGLTPSEAVRRTLRAVLDQGDGPTAGAALPAVTDGEGEGDIRRVELRLTPAEFAALSAVAAQEGLSLPRWLVALVRVHVTGETVLSKTEIAALARSNQILLALVQTLDKIARNEHAQAETDTLALAQIKFLGDQVRTHLRSVSDLTSANSRRWRR